MTAFCRDQTRLWWWPGRLGWHFHVLLLGAMSVSAPGKMEKMFWKRKATRLGQWTQGRELPVYIEIRLGVAQKGKLWLSKNQHWGLNSQEVNDFTKLHPTCRVMLWQNLGLGKSGFPDSIPNPSPILSPSDSALSLLPTNCLPLWCPWLIIALSEVLSNIKTCLAVQGNILRRDSVVATPCMQLICCLDWQRKCPKARTYGITLKPGLLKGPPLSTKF